MQLFHAYAIGVQRAEITSGQLNLVWPSGLQMHDDKYARPEVQATHKILKNKVSIGGLNSSALFRTYNQQPKPNEYGHGIYVK